MSTYLVVAHRTAGAPELREAISTKTREDRRAVFVLLAPATPFEELGQTSDGDAFGAAERSVIAARQALEAEGVAIAKAIVGDADPLAAIQTEFQRARRTYDGIILCTLPPGTSRWLERGLPAAIEATFGVPLTHIIARQGSTPEMAPAEPTGTITFSIRLGSRGTEIAKLVAERLGFRYYDWEITALAAERAGVSPGVIAASEQAQSLLERVLDRLATTGVYEEDESAGRLSSTTMSSAIGALSSGKHRELVEAVVRQIADESGAVLVGHASQVVLRGNASVFKVMVNGSQENRARRVATDEGRSYEDALKLVQDSDAEREAFFKQVYHVNLLDADLYDLTLNSDLLSSEVAASLVISAFRQRWFKTGGTEHEQLLGSSPSNREQ